MYEELYNFVANELFDFLVDRNANGLLQKGERFSLRLDNEEIVKGVYDALGKIKNEYRTSYEFYDKNTVVYTTYKLRINESISDILVVAKINMTDAFLTKIRNQQLLDENGNSMPILMLVHAPNDSILTATEDLSAVGRPFSKEKIIEKLNKKIIDTFSHDDAISTEVLKWALDEISLDRYSDNTSLWSYKEIIRILSKRKIERNDYPLLGLLYDSNKQTENLRERLDENHGLFVKFFDNLKDDNYKALENEYSKKVKVLKDFDISNIESSLAKLDYSILNEVNINSEEIVKFNVEDIVSDTCEFCIARNENKDNIRSKKNTYSVLVYNSQLQDEIVIKIPYDKAISSKKFKYSEDDQNILKCNATGQKINITISIKEKCQFDKFTIQQYAKGKDKKLSTTILNICVVSVPDNIFEDVHNSFVVDIKNSLINVDSMPEDHELVFNSKVSGTAIENQYKEDESYKIDLNAPLKILFDPQEDCISYNFNIDINDIKIYFVVENQNFNNIIDDSFIFCRKFKKAKSLNYKYIEDLNNPQIKIVIENHVYNVSQEFNKLLLLENKMICGCWASMCINKNSTCSENKLSKLNDKLRVAYNDLIEQYKFHQTLPSLAYYEKDSSLYNAAIKYVEVVKSQFSELKEVSLDSCYIDLMRLGCVFDLRSGYHEILFSPLHPLYVEYQLQLQKEKNVDLVREDLINRLTPVRLIPFLNENMNDKKYYSYHPISRINVPTWSQYAKLNNSKYSVAQNFVPNIVSNKIKQYKNNFSYLFNGISNYDFRIGLYNMGDCEEVLLGLVYYYCDEYLRKNVTESFMDFNIYILDEELNYRSNVFSKFTSNKYLYKFINGLKLPSKVKQKIRHESVNEIVDYLVKHVHCYFVSDWVNKNSEYDSIYTHLTFYKMKQNDDLVDGKMNNLKSSSLLDGIMSGGTPTIDGKWYKTGFGASILQDDISDNEDNDLIVLAKYYNSVYSAVEGGKDYQFGRVLVSSIESEDNEFLNRIYEISNWVVFVQPDVDISFFNKPSKSEDDLVVIHYSDQYSNSIGYDDITVSNKTKQYKESIAEKFNPILGKAITNEEINRLIRMFNAINGSWLLKLVSTVEEKGDHKIEEKISILSAVNVCLSYYYSPDIIWIPISMEEHLRVSPGAGLSQSKGLLSVSKLGVEGYISDDILLVGVAGTKDNVKVYIHPVEVKFGESSKEDREEYGLKQVEKAYECYSEIFDMNDKSLNTKLTRNIFMQLVLACCEKMKIYDIDLSDTDWDVVLDDYRAALLNDEFKVENLNIPGYKGTLVMFGAYKDGSTGVEYSKTDKVTNKGFRVLGYTKNEGFKFSIMDPLSIRKRKINPILQGEN